MRNFFNPMPMMPFPPPVPPPPEHHHHDSGEPLVGEIVNGKVFPYGCVMDEVYEADKQEIRNAVGRLAENVDIVENEISGIKGDINSIKSEMAEKSEIPAVIIQETEPDINNCIWIQPVIPVIPDVLPVTLNLSDDIENAEFIAGIGRNNYGITNVATSDEELTVGKYSFEITR